MDTNKAKSYLVWAGVFALIVFSYAAFSYVRTYSRSIQPGSFRSFAVSAEAKQAVKPDIARFTFSIIDQGGKDLGALQSTHTEKMNKVIDFVKKQGVKEDDIKTESYNLEPRYQNYSCPEWGGACPPAEIVGYTINETVSVKVRDFSKVGTLLSGVVQNGANSVSQIDFTIDDMDLVRAKVKAEAMKKARVQAEELAKAGGFKVGQLLSVEEPFYGGFGMGGDDRMEMSVSMVKAAPVPTLAPGTEEVTASVTLRFEIN